MNYLASQAKTSNAWRHVQSIYFETQSGRSTDTEASYIAAAHALLQQVKL